MVNIKMKMKSTSDLFGYIIVVITSTWRYIINYLRSVYIAFGIKGPAAIPLLGNVLILNDNKRMIDLATHTSQYFGSLTCGWISIVPYFYIYEPKHVKAILSSSRNSRKNILYKLMHTFIGEGLITNNGDKWKKHRRLIQPFFNLYELEKYTKVFNEQGKRLAEKLIGHKDLKISTQINECALEVLHNAMLGLPIEEDCPYRQGEVEIVLRRILNPWLIFDPVFKYSGSAKKQVNQTLSLHAYTRKMLMKRKKIYKNSQNSEPECLLDIFIKLSEENKDFGVEDIVNETVTFMLAGQDSVGAATAFTLFFLANNQDVQNKVCEEMKDIVSENCSALDITDLNKLKYLEQVIKESIRLAPSIPVIARILTEDVDLDGLILPEGTNILISPFTTHRLPHIYPNPLKFDPDRFSEENLSKLHPYAYIPFSMGPRNCIGYKFALLEMKTIIYYVLKKWKVSTVPGKENLEFNFRFTLRSKGGVWVRLSPRE